MTNLENKEALRLYRDLLSNKTSSQYTLSDIREWVWGFWRWGKRVQVHISCACARAAFPIWEGYNTLSDEWKSNIDLASALLAAEAWLTQPNDQHLTQVQMLAKAITQETQDFRNWFDEASGSSIITIRRCALEAVQAIHYAIITAAWDASTIQVLPGDHIEAGEKYRHGPAYECVEAAVSTGYALRLSNKDLVLFIRGALQQWTLDMDL